MQLNVQPPERQEKQADGSVYVHSWFKTIQGEGPFAGQAAFFIRLAGCNLQCPGCDTEYTSKRELTTPQELVRFVNQQCLGSSGPANPFMIHPDLVVITGGEPFRQNITPVVSLLLSVGYRVQVETNGTLFDPAFPYAQNHNCRPTRGPSATVVVSPKTARIHPDVAYRASAYKYVLQAGHVASDGLPIDALSNYAGLGKVGKTDGTPWQVARPPIGWEGPIYVQPMDERNEEFNSANVQACVESVLNNPGLTLGFQMHKSVNLP